MKNEKLEITAVDVRGFKRIKHVHIETEDHRNILLIAGKNRQGKSSLMDALDAAFCGGEALPTEPIRKGDEATTIDVELNDGLYKIKRTFKVGKEGKSEGKLLTGLVVTGPDGKLSSPQTWLDNLVAQRFLDPLAFLGRTPAEQRKILLGIVGVDIDKLQAESRAFYESRTEANRALKQAVAQREGLVDPGSAPAGTRSASAIQDELDQVEEDLRAGELAAAKAAKCVEALGVVRAEREAKVAAIEALKRQLAAAEADLAKLEERLVKGQAVTQEAQAAVPAPDKVEALAVRRRTLKSEMRGVEEFVRWESRVQEHQKQVAQLDAKVASHQARVAELTTRMGEIDERKAQLLTQARMPVEGLEVVEDGLRLGGVPLEQASQAEQLRCSLAIAIAQSPRLRDVWAKSGSLLDEEGLETLRQVAADLDCRLWLEMVNERPGDTRAVIIRDGQAVGQEAPGT